MNPVRDLGVMFYTELKFFINNNDKLIGEFSMSLSLIG